MRVELHARREGERFAQGAAEVAAALSFQRVAIDAQEQLFAALLVVHEHRFTGADDGCLRRRGAYGFAHRANALRAPEQDLHKVERLQTSWVYGHRRPVADKTDAERPEALVVHRCIDPFAAADGIQAVIAKYLAHSGASFVQIGRLKKPKASEMALGVLESDHKSSVRIGE